MWEEHQCGWEEHQAYVRVRGAPNTRAPSGDFRAIRMSLPMSVGEQMLDVGGGVKDQARVRWCVRACGVGRIGSATCSAVGAGRKAVGASRKAVGAGWKGEMCDGTGRRAVEQVLVTVD